MGPDSRREHHRRRVEHARDPSKESTPRTADAQEAGRVSFDRELGLLGLNVVKEYSSSLAERLTRIPNNIRIFGSVLRGVSELNEIPSRLEIKQQLMKEQDIESSEIDAQDVGEHQRRAIIERLDEEEILAIATTMASDKESLSRNELVVKVIEHDPSYEETKEEVKKQLP